MREFHNVVAPPFAQGRYDNLNDIQTEMIDLETKIADSSVIIANNITDIDFIRSLDTDTLYGTDGGVRDDVSALLKKHGYEDLEGMSENDIRHILTVIEVQAIEQNIAEQDKITGWLDRHGKLRGQARDIADASPSSDQRQDASDIASRDPEQLARDRMQAVTAQNHAPQETVTEAFVEVKKDLGTQNFSF